VGIEQVFQIVEERKKARIERNLLTRLHVSMCQAAGGWIPLSEFLELPLPYVFNFISTYNEMMEEFEKSVKVR